MHEGTKGCLRGVESMAMHERRVHTRFGHKLFAKFSKTGLYTPIEGRTENISQGGAFVKTDTWYALQPQERIIVTFFLSPDLTGQDKTIGFQGEGIVVRVDREMGGVGVQFAKEFEKFSQIEFANIQQKITYKRLSYYLIEAASVPLTQFMEKYQNGFLVEQSKYLFDKNVIVKVDTDVIEEPYALKCFQKHLEKRDILKVRVLEINKRSALSGPVTIGRAPTNDIVVYNKMVSKSHACIHLVPTRRTCYLIDVGSRNGTLINDQRLVPHQEYQLSDGDEISLGPQTKVVYFSPEAFYKFLELPIS
jgi:hypothetical protein